MFKTTIFISKGILQYALTMSNRRKCDKIGIIDEVAVYKRALTANEVKQDMTKGVVAPVSPAGRLVATWGMIKGE